MDECRSETLLAPGQQEVDRRNVWMLNINLWSPGCPLRSLPKQLTTTNAQLCQSSPLKSSHPRSSSIRRPPSQPLKSANQWELEPIQGSTKTGTTGSQPRTPTCLNFRITKKQMSRISASRPVTTSLWSSRSKNLWNRRRWVRRHQDRCCLRWHCSAVPRCFRRTHRKHARWLRTEVVPHARRFETYTGCRG